MEKKGKNLKKLFVLFIMTFISAGLQAQTGNGMAGTSKPYEQIERKFYDFLTGGSSLDTNDLDVATKLKEINNSAKTYWDSMEKAPDRTYIWSNLPMVFGEGASPFVGPYDMTNTFLRLSVMCQAYRSKGGELYDNKAFGKDILEALVWMNENKYKSEERFGNWWDWQIGSPLRFIDCLVLLKDEMTENQYQKCVEALIFHGYPGVPTAGNANWMWILFSRLMIGVLTKDEACIKSVIEETDNHWFKYTASGDGFYTDGSYIMHSAIPYTGSYGTSCIESLAKLMYLVNGTVYDISPASKAQAVRWINESYAPVIYNGLMMDMVRGRAMTRETEGDHLIGHVIVRSIYLITQTIPENDARQLKELIKYWINNATHRSIYYGEDVTNNNNYLFFINILKQLMNDASIPVADKPVFHKQFASMARIVHSMPEFTFALSMHNDKVCNYEFFNGESLKSWHTANGMSYLYNGDMGQYSDDYWPTIDSYRIPGTTANQNSTVPGNKPNGDSWQGGTSIDDLCGIAGMYLKPFGQTLAAKKSWFMFDDEIVALGSDIHASDNKAVETIIENRKLKPDNSNIFTVDGHMVSESAKNSVLPNPTWMHLSGNNAKSDIGYYFPDTSDVYLVREARSGNWREVNSGVLLTRDSILKANYLTLYFDHGNNPAKASYAYVILPDKSAEQVRQYSDKPDITILENSNDAHGVYENNLRITGVNFWNDEVKTVGMVTSDRKSSVIIKETDTEVFVSVSEPTKQNGVVNIQIDLNAAECLAKDDNITVKQLSPIALSIDVTGKNGMSSYCSFKKAPEKYWNTGTTITRYRLPPPPVGYQPTYIDLNGDGKPDAILSVTANDIPVLWLDDDGSIEHGDLEGNTVNGCLLVDRNKDGKFGSWGDLIVDWVDTDGDGKADMQIVIEYPDSIPERLWPNGQYMIVMDIDNDGVFNYVNWNTFRLHHWDHSGLSNFYADYSGNSIFMHIHAYTSALDDLRLNWENPFLFYDPDGDGLTEMAIRLVDTPEYYEGEVDGKPTQRARQKGRIDWVSMSIDMDNDNGPGNEFDYDMTVSFRGKKGFDYMDQAHPIQNLRGLPEADTFFMDPRYRQMTELIYTDHKAAPRLIFERGEWDEIWFTFDEDDDCNRWERVELLWPYDPFIIGTGKGGIDNHTQNDAAGDRGEWDLDASGGGKLYIGAFDGRLHLYGAEWGCWRIDKDAMAFQGYQRTWLGREPQKFATVKYTDTDNNGFFDLIEYDLDGDGAFEETVELKKMGINDVCEIIDISNFEYADYHQLKRRMSEQMWANALLAEKVAVQCGLNVGWYAKLHESTSLFQKYSNGYWLQLYLYKDLQDHFLRKNDRENLKQLELAYYSSNWEMMFRKIK